MPSVRFGRSSTKPLIVQLTASATLTWAHAWSARANLELSAESRPQLGEQGSFPLDYPFE